MVGLVNRSAFHPKAVGGVIVSTLREHWRFDAALIAMLIVFAVCVTPFLTTATRSAQDLVFSGRLDEPGITMCLDSMTVAPYGNSANYWNHPEKRPSLWQYWNYTFWVYCTGAYFDGPFLLYGPLRWLGAPVFPTAPLLLRFSSFIAALIFLVLTYNFAKRHGGTVAGVFGLLILMTNADFMGKSVSIAPDQLLLLLSVLVLLLAERHAAVGDWTSLVALGLVAGWQHSTKFAGMYVAPVGLLAAYWGWQVASGSQVRRRYRDLSYRVVVLGASAFMGLLLAIPYAAVDLAYWRSILMAPEPIKQATFGSYMVAIQAQEGWVLVVLALAAVLFVLWQASRDARHRALVLTVVLAASNILFWPIFYLEKTRVDTMVLGFGLLAVVSGHFLSIVLRSGQRPAWTRLVGVTAAAALCIWVVSTRWYPVANRLSSSVSQRQAVDHATRAIEGIIPNDASILGDTAALVLFDATKYPNQSSSGTLRYPDLWRIDPEYFYLNQFMFETEKYQQLVRNQHETIFSTYNYSVRLYQDLFMRSPHPNAVGPTNVPGLEVVVKIPGFRRRAGASDELLFSGSLIERYLPRFFAQVNAIRSRLRDSLTTWNPQDYEELPGPGIVIYRLNPAGGPRGRVTPISSGDGSGTASAVLAFDEATGTRWLSRQSGDAVAQQAFLGFDYGGGTTMKVPSVGVTWVDAAHTPDDVVIQYSDDGAVWTDVMRVSPRHPPDGAGGWDETFSLPDAGPHRLWRILANATLASGASMGIAEMRLPDPSW